MQLALAYVHTQHPGSALLQQTIGEAASALPYVQAVHARGVQAAVAQGAFQLEPPA